MTGPYYIMKSTTTIDVRLNNAHTIIHELEVRKEATNSEIAQEYGYSVSTVSNIVNILKKDTMIVDLGAKQSSGGRRPVQIGLNPNYHYFVGIHITKHIVHAVLMNFSGQIVKDYFTYISFEDTEEYWSSIAAICDQMAENISEPISVGIAVPGICDFETDRIFSLKSLGIKSLRISDLQNLFHDSVSVNDEIRLSGIAQLYGKSQYSNSVFLTLNRRVGGGLILNNEIFSLSQFDCSFGDMLISVNSDDSSHSLPGSFSSFCSASQIIDTLREQGIPDVYDDFFAALKEGNPYYQGLWNKYLDYLAIGLHNIRAIFGLDIVIGGEMAVFLASYEDELYERLQKWPTASTFDSQKYLFFSEHGKFDAALGAALYARSCFLYSNLPAILQS